MQHLQYKELPAHARLSLLADHMERTPMLVRMDQSATCAYGHACHIFGEPFDGSESHSHHLARMLGINYFEADVLYCSTAFTRKQVVEHLRALACAHGAPAPTPPIITFISSAPKNAELEPA